MPSLSAIRALFEPTQPPCIDERLRRGDRELFTVFGHPITINEWHSFVIGGSVGFIVGERGIAKRAVLHEPWYALGAFVFAYVLGRLFEQQFRGR